VLSPPIQKALDLGYLLNRSTSCFINSLEGSLVSEIISKISKLESSSLGLLATNSKVIKDAKVMGLQNRKEEDFLVIIPTSTTPSSLPTKIKTILRFLYLIFHINASIL